MEMIHRLIFADPQKSPWSRDCPYPKDGACCDTG